MKSTFDIKALSQEMEEILGANYEDEIKGILPLRYFEETLISLKARGDIEFITYGDLEWDGDYDHLHDFPVEWRNWEASLADGRRDPHKIYILIQHDGDSGPNATVRMAEAEQRLGVRSSIMLFARWRGNDMSKPLHLYPIDWDKVRGLVDAGFTIGLHANPVHVAEFDASQVMNVFVEDYNLLRQLVGDVQVFSPHGGRALPDGRGNADFDYLDETPVRLHWVQNRFSARFNGYYSDGGLTDRLIRNDPRADLAAWIGTLQQGRRYRMLIHPQYYSDRWERVREITAPWYHAYVDRVR